MRYAWKVNTPIGLLTLAQEDGRLTHVRFGERIENETVCCTPLLEQAAQELDEYFSGRRRAFSIPLSPRGTPFQKRCWQALLAIPYGETRTYQQQARMLGNEKACRAVGMANHCNPLPIFIPCHRVIGKNGKLTGYAGGLVIKEKLLALERMNHHDPAQDQNCLHDGAVDRL